MQRAKEKVKELLGGIEMLDKKLDLVRAFMQVEGQAKLDTTITNYDGNGGIQFEGYTEVDGEFRHAKIVMDKSQISLIDDCQGVMEVYECYRQMEYFPE